jgi:hypothetical protein
MDSVNGWPQLSMGRYYSLVSVCRYIVFRISQTIYCIHYYMRHAIIGIVDFNNGGNI